MWRSKISEIRTRYMVYKCRIPAPTLAGRSSPGNLIEDWIPLLCLVGGGGWRWLYTRAGDHSHQKLLISMCGWRARRGLSFSLWWYPLGVGRLSRYARNYFLFLPLFSGAPPPFYLATLKYLYNSFYRKEEGEFFMVGWNTASCIININQNL